MSLYRWAVGVIAWVAVAITLQTLDDWWSQLDRSDGSWWWRQDSGKHEEQLQQRTRLRLLLHVMALLFVAWTLAHLIAAIRNMAWHFFARSPRRLTQAHVDHSEEVIVKRSEQKTSSAQMTSCTEWSQVESHESHYLVPLIDCPMLTPLTADDLLVNEQRHWASSCQRTIDAFRPIPQQVEAIPAAGNCSQLQPRLSAGHSAEFVHVDTFQRTSTIIATADDAELPCLNSDLSLIDSVAERSFSPHRPFAAEPPPPPSQGWSPFAIDLLANTVCIALFGRPSVSALEFANVISRGADRPAISKSELLQSADYGCDDTVSIALCFRCATRMENVLLNDPNDDDEAMLLLHYALGHDAPIDDSTRASFDRVLVDKYLECGAGHCLACGVMHE